MKLEKPLDINNSVFEKRMEKEINKKCFSKLFS